MSDAKSTRQNLNQFLGDYCRAFRPHNMPAMADFFNVPVTMISGGRANTLSTEEQLTNSLQIVMNGLVTQGFDHSEIDEVHIHPLSAKTALLSAIFSRLKTDGSLLQKIGATYTVIDSGEGYKIATLVAHDTDGLVKEA